MSDSEQKSMTPAVRNRIVGSVIILIAAIVILPSVIGTGQVSLKDDFKKVPAKPEFEVVSNDKPFPKTAFEQNMPTKTPPTDEQPLDAAPENVAVTNDQPAAKTVETDTLTVTPMSKPKSFATPDQLAAKQKKAAEQAQAQEQEQTQATDASENVVRNAGASSKTSKPSPFTTQAWVIQLGSFGNKANANAIEKKLNDAGFTTFSRQIQSNHGSLTKVYVGPELDKKVLQKSLSKVNKVANVNGLVTSFTIKR